MTGSTRRRRLLGGIGSALVVGLAGCLGRLDAGSGREEVDDAETADTDDVLLSVERGDREREAVTAGHVATVGENDFDEHFDTHYVPIAFTEDGIESFVDALEAVDAFEEPSETEIHTRLDGETVESHRLGPDLADAMASGEFNGTFRAMFSDEESAAAFYDELAGD